MNADEVAPVGAQQSASGAAAEAARGYRPIADYAAIGDCHGGALIAADAGIDWCALGRFDADPVFCRLLDAARGGYLSVRLQNVRAAERAYLSGTNILRTELSSPSARVAITDFMPVGRTRQARANDYVSLQAPGWLVRRVQCIEGSASLAVDYAASAPGSALHSNLALQQCRDRRFARVELRAGERCYLVVAAPDANPDEATIEALERVTAAFWREWIGYCRYRGPWQELVQRSALALKLMTYAPTGASVAAFTTSLPEALGGERNWDYRYCWVRDASLMLHSLAALGYSGESVRFLDFMRAAFHGPADELQVMYGVGMEKELRERTLDPLDGYCGSRPVRIGNDAYRQRQTDLYGYILEAALVYQRLGGRLTDADRRAFERMVPFIAECWQEPDLGLWETRAEPRHFVHSKAMCWVVVDRAIRLCGERSEWIALRARMLRELLERGRCAEGHFVQAFGDPSDRLDAALLHLPMLALPLERETLTRTRRAVERALRRGDLLHRYKGPDGVSGEDEGFVACSFWLVEALLAEEHYDEAAALFERLAARANDVGLFAEEIDMRSGAFLGNFPQAFSHLALIGAAANLALCRRYGPGAAHGTFADRVHRAVRATIGWRGLAAGLLQGKRTRLISSRASRLDVVVPHVYTDRRSVAATTPPH